MNEILVQLNITQEQYNQIVFDCGIYYLERQFDGYEDTMIKFSKHHLWWKWFKRQFELIDELCIIKNITSLEEYKRAQNGMDYYPSKALSKLIQNDYDKMFQTIKDEAYEEV